MFLEKIRTKIRLSPEELAPLKPFLSVFLIVSSMFIIVLAKMEERRLGYTILRLTREQKIVTDEKRARELTLAQLLRPQHVEKLAQDRSALRKIQNHQIIQLSGGSATPVSGNNLGDKDL